MQALAVLYQRYMDLLYGVCLKYLSNPDDAKDAVLSIYEQLLVKVKQHEIAFFRGWVYQLAKNHCLMQLRKAKLPVTSLEDNFVHSGEELHLEAAMTKENQLSVLEECIGLLQAEQKKSIELFYLKGYCYKAIASETGLDAGKVKSYIQNGRRNLKICMEKKEQQAGRV
jgi:RNA polymerase sigma-70 factor (ECF subfamily)